MHITEAKSKLPLQHNDVPNEISAEDFIWVMRVAFSIFSENVEGKSYAVRFTGSPYDPSLPECVSLTVYTHAKGTQFCPLVVKRVLTRFSITIAAYNEAVAAQEKRKAS